jgi:alpha/beta superfamily hydrolase
MDTSPALPVHSSNNLCCSSSGKINLKRSLSGFCDIFRSSDLKRQILNVVKVALKIILILPFLAEVASTFISVRLGIGTKNVASEIDETLRTQLKTELRGQMVDFQTTSGEKIEGMFFQGNPNEKTILLCSGSHNSFEFFTKPMIEEFCSKGHSVLVFNYTGFGESGGNISKEGVFRSADAAYNFLTTSKKISKENILCWGYSLGSAPASYLATKHGIDVVLDRAFSSISRVAYSCAPKGLKKFTKFVFDHGLSFDNVEMLKKTSSNVWIISGEQDETMNRELHYTRMQKELSEKGNIQFRLVQSTHFHNDENFWYKDVNPFT